MEDTRVLRLQFNGFTNLGCLVPDLARDDASSSEAVFTRAADLKYSLSPFV